MKRNCGAMKSILAVLLIVCLLCLAGCEQESDGKDTKKTTPTVTATPTEQPKVELKGDLAALRKIMLAAEKNAIDPNRKLPAGVVFLIRIENGEAELIYQGCSATGPTYLERDIEFVKEWCRQCDVSEETGVYHFSEKQLITAGTGELRGTLMKDDTLYWEYVNADKTLVTAMKDLTAAASIHEFFEKKIVRIWTPAYGPDVYTEPYEKAIADLKTAYPDVEFLLVGEDLSDEQMRVLAAHDNGCFPEIAYVIFNYLPDVVKNGSAFELGDCYEAYRDELPASMIDCMKIDGKSYMIPYGIDYMAVFANKQVLSSVGYESAPTTYEEFVKCCEKLKQAGITPITCEEFILDMFFQDYLMRYCGYEKMTDLKNYKVSWNDPEIVAAVTQFTEFRRKYVKVVQIDESKEIFEQNACGFMYDGSWNLASSALAGSERATVMTFPSVKGGDSAARQYVGGPQTGLVVNANSEDSEKLAEYAFTLAKLVSRYACESYMMPTWKFDVIPVENKDFVAGIKRALSADAFLLPFSSSIISINDAMDYEYSVTQGIVNDYDAEELIELLHRLIDLNEN